LIHCAEASPAIDNASTTIFIFFNVSIPNPAREGEHRTLRLCAIRNTLRTASPRRERNALF